MGIEIGAVRAFEEKETDFDIFSCACRRLVIAQQLEALRGKPQRASIINKLLFVPEQQL